MGHGSLAVTAGRDGCERRAGRQPSARGWEPGGLGSVRTVATEAEGVILGGLADAARLLHPPRGGAQGRCAGAGGSRNGAGWWES